MCLLSAQLCMYAAGAVELLSLLPYVFLRPGRAVAACLRPPPPQRLAARAVELLSLLPYIFLRHGASRGTHAGRRGATQKRYAGTFADDRQAIGRQLSTGAPSSAATPIPHPFLLLPPLSFVIISLLCPLPSSSFLLPSPSLVHPLPSSPICLLQSFSILLATFPTPSAFCHPTF